MTTACRVASQRTHQFGSPLWCKVGSDGARFTRPPSSATLTACVLANNNNCTSDMSAAHQAEVAATTGWSARLALRFVRDGDVTRLRREPSFGPLYVQKPFYAEPDCTHVYIVHPPGGIVGGDTLTIDIDVEADASALVTTPAATKVYRVAGQPAALRHRLRVRAGATLEWLPLETIAFNDAHFSVATDIVLEPGARCFAWEVTALGRPASEAPFEAGRLHQTTSIHLATDSTRKPLLLERAVLDGGSARQRERWGYADATVSASAWFAPADRALGARLVDALGDDAGDLAVTVPDQVLTLRALASDTEQCMHRLSHAWRVLRQLALGRAATTPRIWNT